MHFHSTATVDIINSNRSIIISKIIPASLTINDLSFDAFDHIAALSSKVDIFAVVMPTAVGNNAIRIRAFIP